ncbi:hypothetical protein TeGR_g477 [Tetraparma gracilis]|nr:hypothetical protein TeGR_g477 [Tetraparma gracilis]
MKCYCYDCDLLAHAGVKKAYHKRKRIITGKPYKLDVLMDGDNMTFPKTFDWVTIHYRMFAKERTPPSPTGKRARFKAALASCFKSKHKYGKLIDSTVAKRFSRAWWKGGLKPLQFQVGCSGPCMHIQILDCANVAAMDDNGLSDPYVAVWYKDTLLGSTRVAPKTLNPTWPNESFVVPLDKNFMNAFKKKEESAVIKIKQKEKSAGHGHDPHAWKPGDPLTTEEAASIVTEVNGEDASAKLPKLRLDVYDWDQLSKNDFLGQRTFSDNDILQVLFEHEEHKVRKFPLEPKKARGVVGIKLSRAEDEKTGEVKLLLQITDGKNLPKADPFNLSDPYCTVTWNGKKEGKTKTCKSTLDPVWKNQYFEFPLPKGDEEEAMKKGELVVDVYDWDRIGSDDHLGMLKFDGAEILKLTEKSKTTAELGLDDEALTIIENEWKRLEGTPLEKDFKLNILHKIDEEARAERERLKLANEEEERRKLQEKIDAGLETEQERKMRKTMEKKARNTARETQRVAKKALRKELKKRGMKSMMDRDSRDTRATGERATEAEDSLSAMLAAAKAEVEDDIEKGVDFEKDGLFAQNESDGRTPGASRQSRQSRKTRGTRTSRASADGKGGSNPNRRGSLMSELNEEQLAALAQDPALLLRQLQAGNLAVEKKDLDGDDGSEDGSKDGSGDGNEDGEEEEEEEKEDDETGYERGVCVQYNEKLGIKLLFEDFDGLHTVEREEWVKLADVPMVVKVGKNPELEKIWKEIDLASQPIWKRVLLGKEKLELEYDKKKAEEESSWMDKMMGRKNLGIKTYYPLFLPDSESGAADVKGDIGLRLIYHTRGNVLRGIDEVVSTMSLGEKCAIHIREDYAFGQAFGHFDLPPNSDITVEVDLIGVRGAGFLYLLISRQLNFFMHKLWLILQVLIWVFELNGRYMCPLWCKTPWVTQRRHEHDEDEHDDFDEDAMLFDDSVEKSQSIEEAPSIETEEKPKESTLGARMLFAKF